MMASHTPIYQKRGSTVVPVITIDDAPSSSANAAGHLVDSNGIANAIAAVEAKIPDLEGVKDIRVSGTTMTVTYIDDSTKTFTLAVSSSTTGPTYSDFTGATASAAGSNGLVPAPAKGKQASFLRGDGTWAAVPNPDMIGASSTSDGVHGLVPQPKIAEREKYLRGDGTWSTPPDTNTTYSNMTAATASAAGTAGLVPAPGAGKQASFLRGDGTWVVPTNTTYSVFTGATTDTAGTSGLVPQPAKGTAGRFLRVDGTWSTPPDTNTTYSVMTKATASAAGTSGLVPAPAAGKQASFLRGDGTWVVPTNTTYSNMTGATSSAAGAAGLVPAPAKGQQNYYLKGDGTWVAASWLPLTGGTLANTSGAAGTNNITGLTIGNNKSIDADGNTYGRITLYGKTDAGDAQAYYTRLTPSRFTANRAHTLPNATGYLAVGSTSGVGNATTPVYMSSDGVLTACSGATGRLSLGDIAYYYSSSSYKDVTVTSKKQGSISYKYAKIPSGGSWLVFVGTSHSGGYSSFSFYSAIAAGGTTYTVSEVVNDNSESGNGSETSRTVLAIRLNS